MWRLLVQEEMCTNSFLYIFPAHLLRFADTLFFRFCLQDEKEHE